MDVLMIDDIADACIDALASAGFEESTMRQYRKIFGYLRDALPGGAWDEDAARDFATAKRPDGKPFHRSYLTTRMRVVSLCIDYVRTGAFDLSVRSGRPPQPMPASPHMLACLEGYARENAGRGLADGTRGYYERIAREYLLFLEGTGVTDPRDADPAGVGSFMADISARWSGTSTYHIASNFRPFLRHLGRDDLVEALALTRPHRDHRPLPTLGAEQAEAVARACLEKGAEPMDAAITLLALTTGLRACDIVALRVSDLDFRTGTLSLVQRKTGDPVTLPMCPALAEALGRYLLESRPETSSPNVFVRSVAPHAPLADHSAVYQATRRVLSSAGVDGGGSLLMRHTAASRMVASGVGLPVVSAVLGHASPDSTDTYIETDDEGMRSCVLPLPEGVAS